MDAALIECDPDAALVLDLRFLERSQLGRLLSRLVTIRQPLMAWLTGTGPRPPRCPPVVLLLSPTSPAAYFNRWAGWFLDCPAFWFAAGFELVDGPALPPETDDPTPLVELIKPRLDRLEQHPLVIMGPRADELFKDSKHKLSGLGPGRHAYDRTFINADKPQEVRIAMPGTFQLEGGLSVPLPAGLTHEVIKRVLLSIAGHEEAVTEGELQGWRYRPSEYTGCTLIPGNGWWYSANASQYVDEPIELAMSHLKVDSRHLKSLERYLRFAWLQDAVFITQGGAVI